MELRAPSSKADAQWSLLSLAGMLRDQEFLVGGCHKFRHVGVTSQELAMSDLPHVCFQTSSWQFLHSAVSGPFAKIPTGPR